MDLREEQELQLELSRYGSRFANVDLSDLARRSIWRGKRQTDIWAFYCPLCACSRRIRGRPEPGSLKHILQIGITTAFFMLLTWRWFAWKGVVALLPLWIAFEVFYRLRTRAALVCAQCGFDPVLYLTDRQAARREVERHWRKLFEEKGIPYPENPRKTAASRPAEAVAAADSSSVETKENPG